MAQIIYRCIICLGCQFNSNDEVKPFFPRKVETTFPQFLVVVHRQGFIRKQLQPAKRSKEVIKLLNLYVSGVEIG